MSLSGTRLGPYLLGVELGRGGMGVVYAAQHEQGGPALAVKILTRTDHSPQIKRFVAEAEVAARLRHPGIVPVVDAGEIDSVRYIAFHRVLEGKTLEQALPSLDRETALRVLQQIAVALGHAHAHGVVHRDVKPDNILVDPSGRAYLTDFGVARVAGGARLTLTGAIVGTLRYLSPEAGRGEAPTPASDVWALGVILYQILSGGHLPFEGDNAFTSLLATENAQLPPLQASEPVPAALHQLLVETLALDPQQRPQTGGEFARRLAAAKLSSPESSGRAIRLAAIGSVVAALAALALVLALVGRQRDARPPAPPHGEAPQHPPAQLDLPAEPAPAQPEFDLEPYAKLTSWVQGEALPPTLDPEVVEQAATAYAALREATSPRADLIAGLAGFALVAGNQTHRFPAPEGEPTDSAPPANQVVQEHTQSSLARLRRAAQSLERPQERELAWATLGRFLTVLKRFAAACEAFEQLEALGRYWDAGRGWHYRLEWAWCHESLDHYDAALEVHDRLRAKDVEQYEAELRLATVHVRRGDLGSALKAAFLARGLIQQLEPSRRPQALEWLARTSAESHAHLGNYAAALRAWDGFAGKLIRGAPAERVPGLWNLHYAECNLGLGELELAEQYLSAATSHRLRSWQEGKASNLYFRLGLASSEEARAAHWDRALQLEMEGHVSVVRMLVERVRDPARLPGPAEPGLDVAPPGRFLDRKSMKRQLRRALTTPERSQALGFAYEAEARLRAMQPIAYPFYWEFLALTLHVLGDYERELEVLRQAVRTFPEDVLLALTLERRAAGERLSKRRE